jgi:hypothetical protein
VFGAETSRRLIKHIYKIMLVVIGGIFYIFTDGYVCPKRRNKHVTPHSIKIHNDQLSNARSENLDIT